MDAKKYFFVVGMVVTGISVVVLMLRFIYGGPTDMWVCAENGWEKMGNPRMPKPESACEITKKTNNNTSANLNNPATKFCLNEGGHIEFRADGSGSMYPACVLENGKECNEWDFYNNKTCE